MAAPQLVFLAGPNGAGKSTFYESYLRSSGLPFVNADLVTRRLDIPNEEAANFADGTRAMLLEARESFITETVFSDPAGAKLAFLRAALVAGYNVRLIFIGLSDAGLSEARVAGRVSQGGHDVPSERLPRRFEQSLLNLKEAITFVPDVTVYDNSSSEKPYQLCLRIVDGREVQSSTILPGWLAPVLAKKRR